MDLEHYDIFDLGLVFLLSVFGTYARILFDCGTSRTRRIGVEFIIGAFAGYTTFFLVKSTELIKGGMELFSIALAGFCARDVLHIFVDLFINKIKLLFSSNKSK
jgi:hypothetical protein